MQEYQRLGHMKKVVDDNSTHAYYLPHHSVLKESSITTKLRVVFDASAPTTTGISLNDIQMVGPTIRDLLLIILCFRQHPYVVGADIAMMYRQVLIEPSQRALQRILWRENPLDQIDTYELNIVTYGMASSPFMAIRCLFSLADEYQESYPEAADIIRKFMYVDDLLFGASSKEKASQLAKNVSHILSSGCFELRKWISNDPQIFEGIGNSKDNREFVRLDEAETTKTLELSWSCTNDELIYHIHIGENPGPTIKRSVLSLIACLFDPLGLLDPCIIVTKIMLQKLWKLELHWDDLIPIDLLNEWSRFVNELSLLNNLRIPGQACCTLPRRIEIHGFSDASEIAYGGCVYIRSTTTEGSTFVELLCTKSRVAPLKPLTIPKLELSATHLLVKLVDKVKAALNLHIDSVCYWSDSTIVLNWIRIEPHRLQTFVRNRVASMMSQSALNDWRHIPSLENPADLLSRGASPRSLIDSRLWWHGPIWLAEPKEQWLAQNVRVITDLPEIREVNLKVSTLHSVARPALIKFQDYSKLERLVRIVAFCKRFIDMRVNKLSKKGPFSTEEIHLSIITLIRIAQAESFSEEICSLSAGKLIDTRSKILALNPFLHNTFRVRGRLRYADFDFDKKHPMILTAKHPLTRLIFENEHRRLLHGGSQALLAQVREILAYRRTEPCTTSRTSMHQVFPSQA